MSSYSWQEVDGWVSWLSDYTHGFEWGVPFGCDDETDYGFTNAVRVASVSACLIEPDHSPHGMHEYILVVDGQRVVVPTPVWEEVARRIGLAGSNKSSNKSSHNPFDGLD